MYAVIRTGGKQYKVKVGDVIDVERIGGDGDNVELVPLLVVDDEGKVSARPSELVGAKVTASILDQHRGDKLRVFTYKNKTGQRHHQGHRQSLTRVRVDVIEPPGGAKAASKAKTATPATTDKESDAKAKPARDAAGAKAGEAADPKAKASEAKASEAKASEAKATEAKAKDTGARAKAGEAKATGAKAGEAKETGAKAKPARAGAKAGEAKATDGKGKAGATKDGEPKPAGRGRARAKQDEES